MGATILWALKIRTEDGPFPRFMIILKKLAAFLGYFYVHIYKYDIFYAQNPNY